MTTTLEQQPHIQSRNPLNQKEDEHRPQSQQQNTDDRDNAARQQSADQEESFTISADDFMML